MRPVVLFRVLFLFFFFFPSFYSAAVRKRSFSDIFEEPRTRVQVAACLSLVPCVRESMYLLHFGNWFVLLSSCSIVKFFFLFFFFFLGGGGRDGKWNYV